jgi:hypothetical protein
VYVSHDVPLSSSHCLPVALSVVASAVPGRRCRRSAAGISMTVDRRPAHLSGDRPPRRRIGGGPRRPPGSHTASFLPLRRAVLHRRPARARPHRLIHTPRLRTRGTGLGEIRAFTEMKLTSRRVQRQILKSCGWELTRTLGGRGTGRWLRVVCGVWASGGGNCWRVWGPGFWLLVLPTADLGELWSPGAARLPRPTAPQATQRSTRPSHLSVDLLSNRELPGRAPFAR